MCDRECRGTQCSPAPNSVFLYPSQPKCVPLFSLNPNVHLILQLPSAEHTELKYVLQEFSFAFVGILESLTALQRHRTENVNKIFPEMKLRGLILNSYIHIYLWAIDIFTVSVCLFGCSKGGPILGILYINCSQMYEYKNWLENETAQFDFWEYINRIFFAVCWMLLQCNEILVWFGPFKFYTEERLS